MSKWRNDMGEKCPKCDTDKETPAHYWTACPTLFYDQWVHNATDTSTHIHDSYVTYFTRLRLIPS